MGGNQSMFPSHIDGSLFPSSLSETNKPITRWGLKKRRGREGKAKTLQPSPSVGTKERAGEDTLRRRPSISQGDTMHNIYHFNYFKVYNSVASSVFKILHDHHRCLVLEQLHHPRENPVSIKQSLSIPPHPPPPG